MTLREHLADAFGRAAPEHFAWQTRGAFVSEREADLVRGAFLPLGRRVLDLGCGEGATLVHLGSPPDAVGVDLFDAKLSLARRHLPECRFVAASVDELPFDAGTFDHVIVRDVVHHLDEPRRMVEECARVLTPGGRIDVLEPCRNNPLILMHALTNAAERGELRSTMHFLVDLLSTRFTVQRTSRYQAFPIHRLVLHPDLGRPSLGENGAARALLRGIERLAESVVPRPFWAYIHVRAIAP